MIMKTLLIFILFIYCMQSGTTPCFSFGSSGHVHRTRTVLGGGGGGHIRTHLQPAGALGHGVGHLGGPAHTIGRTEIHQVVKHGERHGLGGMGQGHRHIHRNHG